MRNKLLFFVLIFSPIWLTGQYSNLIHYTVNDGLPSSTVYSAVQDSLGFMWLGTEAGLVRFDGANFKVFTTQDGLPDNEVLGLVFDNITDRLWIITYSKAACYYRNGQIYTAKNDSTLSIITAEFGEYINANYQPGLGIFFYNGNSVYKGSGNTLSKIRMVNEGMLSVHQWGDTVIDALLSGRGVIRHTPHSESFYAGLASIRFQAPGAVWIGDRFFLFTEGKVIVFTKTISGYEYKGAIPIDPDKFASNLIEVNGKYIISIPDGGVYMADTSLDGVSAKIWSGRANSVASDKDDNIWVMTGDDGIYVIRRRAVHNYSSANTFAHDNITSLYLDMGGVLYIGNSFGELFTLNNWTIKPVKIYYSDKQERVRAITSYDKYVLFITNNTIGCFDTLTDKLKIIKHEGGGLKAILNVPDRKIILIGLASRMLEYNKETHTSRELILKQRMITMAQHPDGRIFCGSIDGLYLYQDDKLSHLSATDSKLQSRVNSLCFSSDSILWIGTPSDGIIAFNGTKVVGHINSSRYLSYRGAMCRKVVSGGPNEIWVATNSGIDRIRYHIQDTIMVDNITPLNIIDGLLSDDVNDILVKDSMIYAATSHGLSILNVNELKSPVPAPIYLSSIRINDKDSAIHDYEYNLSYRQNNIKIEYAGIILPAAGAIRYQYRFLATGNDKWETTSNTSIEFRSLSPGKYTFEVAVLDKFGNRSKHIARVKFHISQAFYMTIWFLALVFLIILGLGFYIIRYVYRRRQMAYEKEQSYNTKIIHLEQQALKAQMNPHFIFNCLTAIQHFVNKEDIYSANMYLSNFAKLIRKTLDLSGEQYITLDKEIAYLENYIQLEKMRFQDKFNYFISVGEEVDVNIAVIPPMLLQPIIENAIRHGLRYKDNNEGVLTVNFNMEGARLLCKIDDNGIGIKKSTELKTNTHVEYQSKGIKLTMSRINAINMISEKKISMEVRDKYDETGIGIGTLVLIYFEQ